MSKYINKLHFHFHLINSSTTWRGWLYENLKKLFIASNFLQLYIYIYLFKLLYNRTSDEFVSKICLKLTKEYNRRFERLRIKNEIIKNFFFHV